MDSFAHKAAEWSRPALPVDANEATKNARAADLKLAAYDIQVGAFNGATTLLVAVVALAIIGLVSMQAAFVMGALFLFIRNEVEKNLNQYQVPVDADAAAALQHHMQHLSGIAQPDAGDNVLNNLGIEITEENRNWEPDAHFILGHVVWKNFHPFEGANNIANMAGRVAAAVSR
jgi:hypothetical protein